LLHFLEHVVSTHFPHLDAFLDELQAPSEANRVNFNDMQSTSKHMLDEILNIRKSLAANFSSSEDGYTRKMFRFSAAAEEQLRDVRDGILNAEKQLRDVQNYYCEGEEMARPMQSQDFFGIFRTFTSSYKVSPTFTLILGLILVLSSCQSSTSRGSSSAGTTTSSSCRPHTSGYR
jgi:cytokinesis protein